MFPTTCTINAQQANATLAAVLRPLLPGSSWRQVRQFIASRRVRIGGDLCLDPARRLHEGETLELLAVSAPRPHQSETIKIRYLDEHLVVAEKPAGMCSVRHPSERAWSAQRKGLSPALEDVLPRLLVGAERRRSKGKLPRLRVVHRLDKETSGLIVFARTVAAEIALGKQFRRHTVVRRYLALIAGDLPEQTISTSLVRDRGDGRRGSTRLPGVGKEAITHVTVVEQLPGYALVSCRLETGRTHQIRIHLAEGGHPICGEKVYNRKPGGEVIPDLSGTPRLALHAAELGLAHPITGEILHWTMPLPPDLESLLERLRGQTSELSRNA